MFSLFRGLVGGKNLTENDIAPVLDKLRDHLISKNVASEISENLCQSVKNKLEGKVQSIIVFYFIIMFIKIITLDNSFV